MLNKEEGILRKTYETSKIVNEKVEQNSLQLEEIENQVQDIVITGGGLPLGGDIGQIPVKKSATNYDVEWQDLTGGDTTDIEAGNLIYRQLDKPMFSFMLDDGKSELYSQWQTYFQPNNIPMCLVYPYFLYPDQLNVKQLNDIIADGGEVISHGYSSATLSVTPTYEVANMEIAKSKEMLEMMGLEVNGFLPAGGGINENMVYLVEDNYSYAFCNYMGREVEYTRDLYHLNRLSMENNLVAVKAAIDRCFTNNLWLCLYGHSIGTLITPEDFAEILAYIAAKGQPYEFVNIKTGVSKISNIGTKENFDIAIRNSKFSKNKGVNLISNPSFDTYRWSGGSPVAWTFDDTNLTGTYTKSTGRSAVQSVLSLNFASSNVSGDYLLLSTDVFLGKLVNRASGYFSLNYLTSRNAIEVTVDLYNGNTFVENLLIFNSSEKSKICNFEGNFITVLDSLYAKARITIKVYADAASWYLKLWNPVLEMYDLPNQNNQAYKGFAHAYTTVDNKLTAKEILTIGDGYSFCNMIYNGASENIAPFAAGIFKLSTEIIMTDAYSGSVTVSFETSNSQVSSKVFTLVEDGTKPYILRYETFMELKAGETVGVYIDKSSAQQPFVKAGSSFIIEQK